MKHWIFQGNPKQFNIDEYILDNKVVSWSIRQKQFVDKVNIGDKVFLWRSDGGKKNTGGIIAHAEVISDVFEEDEYKVELKIEEYRLTNNNGMLLRHHLKVIPETMNLQIIKIATGTNFLLGEGEYQRILKLWNNPSLIDEKFELPTLDKYMHLFKIEGVEKLENNEYIQDSYDFFRNFSNPSYLESMEWENVQELGNHINAFRMALARKRALGEMNAPIEKYRKSFTYLIHGEAPLRERIDRFLTEEQFKLFGFGQSVVSEMLGNIFPEENCFYNQRDKVAVENVLEIVPNYTRGDTYGERFMKFQESIKREGIAEKYKDIVGKRTNLPIYFEIDQFLSFLYENFSKVGEEIPETSEPKYWMIAAGENSKLWDDFYTNSHIAIGWDELGDLRQYSSKVDMMDALIDVYQVDYKPHNDAHANYQFCYEMQVGDYVFVKRGNSHVIGFGKIIGEYKYDETIQSDFRSIRQVEWDKVGEWYSPGLPTKTLTEWTMYEDAVERLLALLNGETGYSKPVPGHTIVRENLVYDHEQFLKEVFMSEEKAEDIKEALEYKKNIILQGPPGVGKTFVAKRLAYLHMREKDPDKVEMIQFHQSYTYEDFIRGYKPNDEGSFSLNDGIFYKFCQKAINDPESNYYMIIDEINRGNLSKIFGELMMLLESDKRGKEFALKLAYSKDDEVFYIPKNLYLIGTMNTADRSLALVDYALRRRFTFISVVPAFNNDKFEEFLRNKNISQGLIDKIITSVTEINNEIAKDVINLGKGYEIGHSYFCPATETIHDEQNWYDRVIRLEVAPLLREYWFDQEEKVDGLLEKFN
ncbi:AAA family ATPase [Virgibacillus litoralis]|uniref:MoxR-like ATPase/predicted RNA-binding protein with PUA-like domain n=1 Tax=Virgibacillus litoralis TaxID=578221 RepID=A0ABS4H898_9BACI|nr:AAA family ATPase [Virgibacillus litoralis]MBP1947127.1 MoxR-like ATPase/predicted RNA-binding protein with PUA-like domain [Virgibacillus litoralis]